MKQNYCYQCRYFESDDYDWSDSIFWSVEQLREFLKKEMDEEDRGLIGEAGYSCVRYPQVFFIDKHADSHKDNFCFPSTYPLYWCGEFKKHKLLRNKKNKTNDPVPL